MTESNGAAGEQTPVQGSGLTQAIEAHAAALVKANTRADGMMAINPMQLFVDLELLSVKVALMYQALADLGVDPKALMTKLRDKLNAEAVAIEAQDRARVVIASGRVPRNG